MDPDPIREALIEQRLDLVEQALRLLSHQFQVIQATLNEAERARISERLRTLMADNPPKDPTP